MEKKGSWPI